MGKQPKKSFFNSKKINKFGKMLIVPLVLGLLVLLILTPIIKKRRIENFKKKLKAL